MQHVRIKEWKRVQLQGAISGRCVQLHTLEPSGPLLVNCAGLLLDLTSDLKILKEQWRLPLAEVPLDRYPRLLTKFSGENVLVAASNSGLQFFGVGKSRQPIEGPQLEFGEFFVAEKVLLGNIYPDSNVLGVLAASTNRVAFYGITESNLKSLTMELLDRQIQPGYFASREFWSHRIAGTEYESLFTRTADGIDCFYFDRDYNLERRFSFSELPSSSSLQESIKFLNWSEFESNMVYSDDKSLFIYNVTKLGMEFVRYIKCHRCDVNSLIPLFKQSSKKSFAISGSNGFDILSWETENVESTHFFNDDVPKDALYSALIGQVGPVDLLFQNLNSDLLVASVENFQDSAKVGFEFFNENIDLDSFDRKYDLVHAEQIIAKKNINKGQTLVPHLPWWSMNDLKFLENAANRISGQLEFKIPIVTAPVFMENTMEINLYYSSAMQTAKNCGIGFDLVLPVNFIQVDRHRSIFEKNFQYYVYGDQGRVELFKEKQSDTFTSTAYGNSTFTFDRGNQTWTVKTPERTLRYGGHKAVQWTLGWKNWAGPGTDISRMERIPLTWYLTGSREADYGVDFTYEYEQTNNRFQLGGPEFTYSTNLVKIYARDVFSIAVEWGDKERSEFKQFVPPQTKPFLMPPMFENNRYIKTLQYTATNRQQHFEFEYRLQNSKRILINFSQLLPPLRENILSIQYADNSSIIESIESKAGAKYDYQYEQVQAPEILPNFQSEYKLVTKPTVADGGFYKVFVYLDWRFSRSICVDVFEDGAGKTIANLVYEIDSEFEINAWDNGFIVLIQNTKEKLALFFSRSKNDWERKNIDQMSLTHNTWTRFFYHGIAAQQKNDIVLTNWDKGNSEWNTESFTIKDGIDNIAVSEDFISYISNANEFFVIYQKDGSWQQKRTQLKCLSTTLNVKNVLQKFNHTKEGLEQLTKLFMAQSLQISGNTILVFSMRIESHELVTHIEIYTMNKYFELRLRFEKEIERIRLLEIYRSNEIKNDTINNNEKHILKHKFRDDRYILELSEIRSEAMERAADRKTPLQVLQKEYEKYLGTSNAVDWNKLIIYLNSEGVHSEKVFIFNSGTEFKTRDAKYSMESKIGDNITIKEADFDDKKILIESSGKRFSFSGGSKFVNGFPRYMAYQDEKNIMFLTLNEKGIVSDSAMVENAQLIGGNGTHIEAMMNLTLKESYSFKYTEVPIFSLLALPLRNYIKREHVILSGAHRITNFRRQVAEKKSLMVQTYWQDNEDYAGRQEIILIPTGNHIPRKITKWYNCKGELEETSVEHIEEKSKERQTLEKNQKNIIFDRSGGKIIAKIAPYTIESQEVSYYGFETYEANISNWKFKTDHIQTNVALTGKNCLYVDSTSKLVGNFNPKTQQNEFVLASWIKLEGESGEVDIGDPIGEVTAKIFYRENGELMRLKGLVQRKGNGWTYVELYLNFEALKESYQGFFNQQSGISKNLPRPVDVTFTFEVIVEPAENSRKLYVDHIRFFPVELHSECLVFDERNGHIMQVIKRNGEIENKVHDIYGNEIASYNEESDLEWFEVEHSTTYMTEIKKEKIIFSFELGQYVKIGDISVRGIQVDPVEDFSLKDGKLWCLGNYPGKIILPVGYEWSPSFGFRMAYEIFKGGLLQLTIPKNSIRIENTEGSFTTVSVNGNTLIRNKLTQGELIFLRENHRLVVLVDGELILDKFIATLDIDITMQLHCQSMVAIKDIIKFLGVGVVIEYFTELGQKKQIVQLESEKSVLVMENIYDSLGRSAITTKLTKLINSEENLLSFVPSFVENEEKVWESGKMAGLVNTLNVDDEGFPYTRTTFHCSPLNTEAAIGQPGKEYSVEGPFHKVKNMDVNITIIDNMFPKSKGYHHEITKIPNQSLLIYVYDEKKNKVAKYEHVDGYDKRLTTYNYDHNSFNRDADTAIKITSDNQNVLFAYDRNGNVVNKYSPDTGTQEFAYDDSGRKVLESSTATNSSERQVLYYQYDDLGNLVETGSLVHHSNKNLSKLSAADLSEKVIFQEILYYDVDLFAKDRSNKKKIKTPFFWDAKNSYNKTPLSLDLRGNVIDEIEFTRDGSVASKSTILAANDIEMTEKFEIYMKNFNKKGKFSVLSYPLHNGDRFNLHHTYNKVGALIGLGSADDPYKYFKFSYNALGNLVEEIHLAVPEYQFSRNYEYNSPGYLISITDPFLRLQFEYTKGGYGQDGFGDGIVMEMRSVAKWTRNSNPNWFKLSIDDLKKIKHAICHQALRRIGVLSDGMSVLRMIDHEDFLQMPSECSGSTGFTIHNIIAKRYKAYNYGYKFRYGLHHELLNAKFFTQESEATSPVTLASITNILTKTEKNLAPMIWNSLVDENFITTDIKTGQRSVIGRPNGDLFSLPKSLEIDLGELLAKYFFNSISADINNLTNFFRALIGCLDQKVMCSDDKTRNISRYAQDTMDSLIKSSLIRQESKIVKVNIFETKLLNILKIVPKSRNDILRELYYQKFRGMLTHPFDFEAFDSDSNGNHKKFYRGFKRYQMQYRMFTNQIEKIRLIDFHKYGIPDNEFTFDHDARGNVIRAMYKNIQIIKYHPVSQRTLEILMKNGTRVRYIYDSAGERLKKLVYNNENRLILQTLYVRDEKGRVLVDVKTEFSSWPKKEKRVTETIYLYGTKHLIAFVRNGRFHSVITDHAGSTRLVVRNGKVVASYDYFPYGELQKTIIIDPSCTINYLFTGKEFDAESGLYNYHARMYDPTIGRFYQPDPQAQYFNPYLYSGNSPVSMADPDGEFAFLIAIFACAMVGAYLGGAAASNEWNPSKWNWKSGELWAAIAGGFIGGALVPITGPTAFIGLGIGAKVALVGFAVSTAYIVTAMANESWDPIQWDWSSPKTINGIFTGFTSGLSLVSGIKVAHTSGVQFINKVFAFKGSGKIFLGLSYTVGVGYAYGKISVSQGTGKFWKWDFNNPAVLGGFLDSFDSAFGWPQNFAEIGRGMFKFLKVHKYLKSATNFKAMFKNLKSFESVASNPLFKTSSSLVMASLMASSANAFSGEWKNDFSTYESFFNGIFFGKDIRNMIKTYNTLKLEGKSKKINKRYTKILEGSNLQLDITGVQMKKMITNYLLDISSTLDNTRKPIVEQTLDAYVKGEIQLQQVKITLQELNIGKSLSEKLKILQSSIDPESDSKKILYPDEKKSFLICGARRRRRAASDHFMKVMKENDSSSTGKEANNSLMVSWIQRKSETKRLIADRTLKSSNKLDSPPKRALTKVFEMFSAGNPKNETPYEALEMINKFTRDILTVHSIPNPRYQRRILNKEQSQIRFLHSRKRRQAASSSGGCVPRGSVRADVDDLSIALSKAKIDTPEFRLGGTKERKIYFERLEEGYNSAGGLRYSYDDINKAIENCILEYKKIERDSSEIPFNGFIHGYLERLFGIQKKYIVKSQLNSGKGAPDLVIIPNDINSTEKPIVIELKTDGKGPKFALEQIEKRMYAEGLPLKTLSTKIEAIGVDIGKDSPITFDSKIIDISQRADFIKAIEEGSKSNLEQNILSQGGDKNAFMIALGKLVASNQIGSVKVYEFESNLPNNVSILNKIIEFEINGSKYGVHLSELKHRKGENDYSLNILNSKALADFGKLPEEHIEFKNGMTELKDTDFTNVNTLMEKLAENFEIPHQMFFEERYFQYFVKGFIENVPLPRTNKSIFKWIVFDEVILDANNRLDLTAKLIETHSDGTREEKKYVVIETKINKFDEAVEQLKRYKENENYDALTFIKKEEIDFIPLVYDKRNGKVQFEPYPKAGEKRSGEILIDDGGRKMRNRAPGKRSVGMPRAPRSRRASPTTPDRSSIWCRVSERGESYWCSHGSLQIVVTPSFVDECQLAPSVAQERLSVDSYSRCRLLGGNVFCEGKRSSLFVTQEPRFNALDALTAQLMLLRVGMHTVGGLWKALVGSRGPPEPPRLHVDQATLCRWEATLQMLQRLEKEAQQPWAAVEIEECRKIVDEVATTVKWRDLDLLEERLEALSEDLAECIGTTNLLNSNSYRTRSPTNNPLPAHNYTLKTQNLLSTAPKLPLLH